MNAAGGIALDRMPARATRGALPVVGAVALAASAMAIAVVGASDRDTTLATTFAIVVGAWSVLAVFLACARSYEPLWAWCALAALTAGAALADDNLIGLVPFAFFTAAATLPTGVLKTPGARASWVLGAVFSVPCFIAISARDDASTVVIVEALLLAALAVFAAITRSRAANAIDRARLQWAGWGVVVAGAAAGAAWLVHQLVGWPEDVAPVVVACTAFVPLALALAAVDRLALRIDRLLVRTIEGGGLVLLIGVIYLVVVLGFGDAPDESGKRVLGLSMIAAATSALLFMPARARLLEFAQQRVYGERRERDEPLQTFGARMSRAIPLDELLLQLAESLKRSMQLAAAEVWTGADGLMERSAAVPYREPTRFRLSPDEIAVVTRAHVSGNAWVQVWLPQLLDEHPGRLMRVAPLAHSGELLGFLLCARSIDDQPFLEEEERVLTELARQVALALHNSALDTALQASLDDLRIANEELRASRARIVAASDQSRRQIERNLHDGAQQHLVALAVKLGLARQLLDADPAAAGTLLEELRNDAQQTLTELRELAHGIYPPLLMDRGLSEALRAAANRSVLPATVEAHVGRFPPDVEAAVYFCCLEAIQNAGKHAGEGSHVTITVDADDHELSFVVADDGAGFDTGSTAVAGHGFVNMVDRVGAIGGTLAVDSKPGAGTRVSGRIPLSVPVQTDPS
jgi:signal transduction histidine kinase